MHYYLIATDGAAIYSLSKVPTNDDKRPRFAWGIDGAVRFSCIEHAHEAFRIVRGYRSEFSVTRQNGYSTYELLDDIRSVRYEEARNLMIAQVLSS
jgi:hypothetical protein